MLQWWASSQNISVGMLFARPPHTYVITMDASLGGWGGHMKKVGSESGPLFADLYSVQEQLLHINQLELRAVRKVLSLCTPHLQGQSVLI